MYNMVYMCMYYKMKAWASSQKIWLNSNLISI